MRGRVIGANGIAAVAVNLLMHQCADRQLAAVDFAVKHMHITQLLLRVRDRQRQTAIIGQNAGIADLAAAFGIKRCLVEHQRHLIARLGHLNGFAVFDNRKNLTFGGCGLIADKLGRPMRVAQVEPDGFRRLLAGTGPIGAGFGALLLHRRVKPGRIDGKPALAQRILGQVKRKAVSVIKFKRNRPVQRVTRQIADFLIKQFQPTAQHIAEPFFFMFQRFDNQGAGPFQLGIGGGHLRLQRRHKLPQQRLFGSQHMRMAHGAAHDAAQHIAAPFI